MPILVIGCIDFALDHRLLAPDARDDLAARKGKEVGAELVVHRLLKMLGVKGAKCRALFERSRPAGVLYGLGHQVEARVADRDVRGGRGAQGGEFALL